MTKTFKVGKSELVVTDTAWFFGGVRLPRCWVTLLDAACLLEKLAVNAECDLENILGLLYPRLHSGRKLVNSSGELYDQIEAIVEHVHKHYEWYDGLRKE